jgi:hypothetical protein
MYLSNQDVLRLFTGEVTIKNIPEFTKLCEARPCFVRRGWEIIIEHPSFPRVDPSIEADVFPLEFAETKERKNRKLYFD